MVPMDHYPPQRGRFRRVLRLTGWNILLSVMVVVLVALAGEAYLRLTVPFMRSAQPTEFVPGVGHLRPPNTEIRHTNQLDFWAVSRTNSLGFLDREPPTPEQAAATCHISIIGDSFVEALQVPIRQKLQVRLEKLAAGRLPHLDITTSAFGFGGSSQVRQLSFYDEYARRLHPKLLVLVFVDNDVVGNAPGSGPSEFREWSRTPGLEPTVRRRSDGTLELAGRIVSPEQPPTASWAARALRKAVGRSWFALWLHAKKGAFIHSREGVRGGRWLTRVKEFLEHGEPLEGRRRTLWPDPPPFFEENLEYTRFALEQFKERADRDGAKLVILAAYPKTYEIIPMFEWVGEIAATLGIPVIDQADYILRQGAEVTDARWPHDNHWRPVGHQWAAEALLEYIEQHREVCDG